MQAPRADLLDPFQLGELTASIQDMIDDPQASVSITYREFVASTLNVQSGIHTPSMNNVSTTAFAKDVTIEEVNRSGGTLQVGDRRYLVDQADLSRDPKTQDRIVEGTTIRKVVEWKANLLRQFYEITARRV